MKNGLRVIDLPETDAYQRGLHHGEELRGDLQELHEAWREHCVKTTSSYLPKFLHRLFGPISGRVTDKIVMQRCFCIPFLRFIPGEMKEEMQGIAKASGIPVNFIYLINCLDEIFRTKLQQCSGFAFQDTDANVLIAITQDYGLLVKYLKFTRIFRYPLAPTPFLSVSFAGYIGVFRGMNAQGVALGYLTSHAKDVRQPGKPQGLWLREILSCSLASFDNVTSNIISGARTIGSNILVCDSKEAKVLELTPTAHGVREAGGTTPLIVTNHPLTEKVQRLYKPERWIPGSESSPYIMSPEYSESRLSRLEELLSQGMPRTPEEARKILADDGVCNETTLRTTIFDPAHFTVWSAVIGDDEMPPVAKGRLVPTMLFDSVGGAA